jgi:branched-chain amino acid transport system substrate-binding protein
MVTRRQFNKLITSAGIAAVAPQLAAPAFAQQKPIRIGLLAARSGVASAIGEISLRSAQWTVDRFNKEGGIAGRKIELVPDEESTPKDTIERFRRLVLQEKVDCVHGLISTGTSLAIAPIAEEERVLVMLHDGTTQDGVKETMANPNFVFRSTDNECEAVMASLLAVKYFKGKFKTIANISPDYSYGRNNWEAFRQILKRYDIDAPVVAEQWPKIGTMDLTSHVAALKAAKPDLIFSSMFFADLPIFMKQAHAAGLWEHSKLVLPAGAVQMNNLRKEFTPENIILGHNTMYFAHPQASPLQKAFVSDYMARYKEAPSWSADRPYFCLAAYKAGVEAAYKAVGRWPKPDEIAAAIPNREVESLGGMGRYRSDKISVQMFYQGLTTNKNEYDFPTLRTIEKLSADQLQKPAGADFWNWIKTMKLPV